MPLLLLFLLLGGCVTLTEEEKEEKEYQRLDYIESQFKPAVIHCKNTGGVLYYDGHYNAKIKRILDREEWHRLSRTDIIHFRCLHRG